MRERNMETGRMDGWTDGRMAVVEAGSVLIFCFGFLGPHVSPSLALFRHLLAGFRASVFPWVLQEWVLS